MSAIDLDIDDKDLLEVLAWAGIGFGAAAALTPRIFEGLYGLRDNPDLRVMVRLWGTGTAALSAATLRADQDQRHQLAMIATAMNLANGLLVATAGDQVRLRSRVLGVLTSAVFAAGFGSTL